MATLIKVDRNGSKHWKGLVTCDRCGGRGYYALGTHNGHPVLSPHDGGVCWKCGGNGKVEGTWIERTPEYQAKLDARRQAKQAAKMAEMERIRKEREEREAAERKAREEAKRAREEAIRAQKAISQFVGNIGDKLDMKVTFVFGTDWDTRFGRQYLFSFKDADGNVLVWKTSTVPMVLDAEGRDITIGVGDEVFLKGTVKDHTEYKEEKQTILTRCKLNAV